MSQRKSIKARVAKRATCRSGVNTHCGYDVVRFADEIVTAREKLKELYEFMLYESLHGMDDENVQEGRVKRKRNMRALDRMSRETFVVVRDLVNLTYQFQDARKTECAPSSNGPNFLKG